MKVWQIILLIILGFGAAYLFNQYSKEEVKDTVPVKVEATNIDSLKKEILQLKKSIDSLVTEIQTTFINTKKAKKQYYEKDNSLKYINADSNISLFTEWNRQLQESNYRERYFSLGADTIY